MKKYYLLTPGPTPIPPQVAARASLPVLHHRTREFGALFVQVLEDLRTVFQTQHDVLLFTASGTGAMEAAVVNLLSPGERVLVATSGAFGDRWVKICKAYGIEPEVLKEEWGRPINPENVVQKVKKDPSIRTVLLPTPRPLQEP